MRLSFLLLDAPILGAALRSENASPDGFNRGARPHSPADLVNDNSHGA